MRRNKSKSFTRKQIRLELDINFLISNDCLDYLVEHKKVKLIRKGWDRYQWREE